MPVYEFKCKVCNRITMKNLPISSNVKKVKCIHCNEDSERFISLSNFNIKGYSYKNGYSKGEK